MSTTGADSTSTASMSGPDGPAVECGPGTHWDEATQTCVPDGGGEEIAATTSESTKQAEEK